MTFSVIKRFNCDSWSPFANDGNNVSMSPSGHCRIYIYKKQKLVYLPHIS